MFRSSHLGLLSEEEPAVDLPLFIGHNFQNTPSLPRKGRCRAVCPASGPGGLPAPEAEYVLVTAPYIPWSSHMTGSPGHADGPPGPKNLGSNFIPTSSLDAGLGLDPCAVLPCAYSELPWPGLGWWDLDWAEQGWAGLAVRRRSFRLWPVCMRAGPSCLGSGV